MAVKSLLTEKRMRGARRALDDATEEMIKHAESLGIETVFIRQAKYDESFLGIEKSRCYFGTSGVCCRQCVMGPCRIWLEDMPMIYRLSAARLDKGTCGASVDTIMARSLLTMVGRGTAAHASQGQNFSRPMPHSMQAIS